MWLIYDLTIHLLLKLAGFLSVFNPKLSKFFAVRKKAEKPVFNLGTKPVLCFHCASLGEFQMIVPLLSDENLRRRYTVLVSFFSPSGYENAKIEGLADDKIYLPFDTKKAVLDFLDTSQISLFVFVKYDFWFQLIRQLKNRGVPIILVNGLFRSNQFLLKPMARPLLKMLAGFDKLFVQNQESKMLLEERGIQPEQVVVTGDLRYDRVIQICEQAVMEERIRMFKGKQKLLILGSSWEEEEQLAFAMLEQNRGLIKLLIAPHDISPQHIQQIQNLYAPFAVNVWTEAEQPQADVLILNTIGKLSSAYSMGDYALIGGGFGKGLHNILEAATFGMPMFCGPKIEKFPEAEIFKNHGVLFVVNQQNDLHTLIADLQNDDERAQKISETSRNLVRSSAGSAAGILHYLNHG